MLLYNSRFDAVTEAYYGKTEELIEIEKELDKYIKKFNGVWTVDNDKVKIDEDPKNFANSECVKNIEKLFEKMFKLEEFILVFYTPLPFGVWGHIPNNAYTYPKVYNMFRKKESKKRVDSTGMTMSCNVDVGLIIFCGLNASELLAIILHEIGHNMSASVSNFIYGAGTLSQLLDIFNATDIMSKGTKFTEEVLDKVPGMKTFFRGIQAVSQSILGLIPKKVLAVLNPLNIFNFTYNLITFKWVAGYKEEKYADSFATAYGYGVPLASALEKMKYVKNIKTDKIIDKVPVVNLFYDLGRVQCEMVANVMDVHPSNSARVMAQLKKLKRELNNPDIDQRQKKMIQENIDEMEKFVENYYLSCKAEPNKGRLLSTAYKNIQVKVFGGSADPRELMKFSAKRFEE